MILVEGDGLAQSIERARDLFVGMERGEGESGVVIDGDVEALDAGAWVADGPVAGGADTGACEAAQLLDVGGEGDHREHRVRSARRAALEAPRKRAG